MSRWEYQVIHLNVEDSSKASHPPVQGPASTPEPPAPAAPPAPPTPVAGQPVFSKAYLEQEFPNFYNNPPQQQPQPQQQSNHPALQLQHFLNGHGQQGWSLVGIYPLGSLLMMFFRRRIPDPPAPAIQAAPSIVPQTQPDDASAAAQHPVPAAVNSDDAPPPSTPLSKEQASPTSDLLHQILQRLDSLEGRSVPIQSGERESVSDLAQAVAAEPLPNIVRPGTSMSGERRLRRRSSASSAPMASQSPSKPAVRQTNPVAASPPAAADVAIVSTSTLASLQGEVGIPTFHAAKALEYRSYATLAGFGSRHGYPLGLIKEGANKMAAIYVGLDQGDRGGRAKRLWVVISVDRLRALENR